MAKKQRRKLTPHERKLRYQALRASLSENEEIRRSMKLIATAWQESDRGTVITFFDAIETSLEALLRTKFKAMSKVKDKELNPLFDSKSLAPIGSAKMKTVVARCMGLIDVELKRIIEAIREIRNTYSHSMRYRELTAKDVQPLIDIMPNGFREVVNEMLALSRRRWVELWNSTLLCDPPFSKLKLDASKFPRRRWIFSAVSAYALMMIVHAENRVLNPNLPPLPEGMLE